MCLHSMDINTNTHSKREREREKREAHEVCFQGKGRTFGATISRLLAWCVRAAK